MPLKSRELTFYKSNLSKKCALPFFLEPVRAGFPSFADNYFEQSLDLNEHLIQHPAATFFVRVEGDSMQGAGIQKQDILIVDRSLLPTNGKIVIAIINGEFTVKRIRVFQEKIVLEAENPNYTPIQIDPNWDFQVWGVVTYVIHKAV